jgi:hypothetical protein
MTGLVGDGAGDEWVGGLVGAGEVGECPGDDGDGADGCGLGWCFGVGLGVGVGFGFFFDL